MATVNETMQTIPDSTDRKKRASFDREGGATRGGRLWLAEIGAYSHAARHALKRVE